MWKLSDFDYTLPQELIAQHPLEKRDTSRLLVLEKNTQKIYHKNFSDIIDYLNKGDILVLNDTEVVPARLIGKKPTGGKVDCLLLEKKSGRDFYALLKPSDLKPGAQIDFNAGSLKATVIDKKMLRFNTDDADFIYSKGVTPLPPYIKRLPDKSDSERYQTVFARSPGAVAAPTAGLHFTKKLLSRIKSKGIKISFVTLHVNYATFNPVKENDITQHKMYREYYRISRETLQQINKTKEAGGRVFCVGTTTVRVLETLAKTADYGGYTDLFIYPGYKFKMVDCLLTNFHLPRTTLLMLVSAFCAAGASAYGRAGIELVKKTYQEAIDKRYRFYSYGDAILII